MKDKDSRTIWEQYDSPGRMGGGDIPFPDGRGEMEQPNGYTDTGFEELHDDLKNAFRKALELDAALPSEKKGEDYAELHHNFLRQVRYFIEEIDIKINN